MTYYTYLAGAIQHDPNPERWRNEVIESNNINNIEFINPLDIEDADHPDTTVEDIVEGDLAAIRNSDALLVRWKKDIPKAGTPMEMVIANGWDIPVVTWYEGELDELSPWIKYFSSKIIDKGSESSKVLQTVITE